ncbi:hypothetical protein BDZ45DRAFT_499260 [Acephala macrosclerotiorum]|nr:hypothetical protein BDZ45DRAFT_499260 [Acephala macrosclerotiorum]
MKDGCRGWKLGMRFLYVEKGSWTKRPQFSLDDSAFNAKAISGMASRSSPNYPDHQIISGKSILLNSVHPQKEEIHMYKGACLLIQVKSLHFHVFFSTFSVQLHFHFVTLLLSSAYEERGWDCLNPETRKLDALDNGCCSSISNFTCK